MEYRLTRSNRKTISIRIDRDLSVDVRAPVRMSGTAIDAFVRSHEKWISEHIEKTRSRNEYLKDNALTAGEIVELKQKARDYLPERVSQFAEVMGVRPTGVRVTSAVTRWGSCNAANSICFSYRLMLLPPPLIDLIVVHELAHIRAKNHGPDFHAQMQKYMPDYRDRMKTLRNLRI